MNDPPPMTHFPEADGRAPGETVSEVDATADSSNLSASAGPRAARTTMSERMIDLTLEQSFPASDPPGWTLGV